MAMMALTYMPVHFTEDFFLFSPGVVTLYIIQLLQHLPFQGEGLQICHLKCFTFLSDAHHVHINWGERNKRKHIFLLVI